MSTGARSNQMERWPAPVCQFRNNRGGDHRDEKQAAEHMSTAVVLTRGIFINSSILVPPTRGIVAIPAFYGLLDVETVGPSAHHLSRSATVKAGRRRRALMNPSNHPPPISRRIAPRVAIAGALTIARALVGDPQMLITDRRLWRDPTRHNPTSVGQRAFCAAPQGLRAPGTPARLCLSVAPDL